MGKTVIRPDYTTFARFAKRAARSHRVSYKFLPLTQSSAIFFHLLPIERCEGLWGRKKTPRKKFRRRLTLAGRHDALVIREALPAAQIGY
jgi:hypothetical protein